MARRHPLPTLHHPIRASVAAVAVLVAALPWGGWPGDVGRALAAGETAGGLQAQIARLTQEAFVLVGTSGALIVNYPPGWVVSQPAGPQGGAISVSAGDGSATFEYALTLLPRAGQTPDSILRGHLLPRLRQGAQNVRVLRETPPLMTMMGPTKGYVLSGVQQGRQTISELALVTASIPGLYMPDLGMHPGQTMVLLMHISEVVGNEPSRFPILLAMSLTARGIAASTLRSDYREEEGKRREGQEWKRGVAEANCWAELYRRDKRTWLARGGGVPDSALFDRSRCQ